MRFPFLLLLLLPASPATAAPPDSLTARETHNLMALAQAVGSVKYFYPNRHTAHVSWETVLVRGIPAVRRARTEAALARSLDSLLRPVAPAIQITTAAPYPPPEGFAADAKPVYFWEHHGLGCDKTGLPVVRLLLKLADIPYRSTIRPAADTVARRLFPDGQHQYRATLTDSVRLQLPLVLTAAQYRQRLAAGRPTNRVRRLSARTPEQRLATIMLVWNVLQHFYPYRAVLAEAHWETALPQALQQAAGATSEAKLLAACRTLLARLPDRHVAIGPKTRTGLRIINPPWALRLVLAEGQVVVQQAPPSLRAQVVPGAIITHVNGRPAAHWLDSLQTMLPATSQAVARQLAAEQILTHLAATAPAATFTLCDSLGHSTSARWTFRQLRGSLYRQLPPVREVAPGLVYLDAARLRYPNFRRGLPQLQAARGLIVDLRQRPHYDLLRVLPHFSRQPLLADSLTTPLLRQPAFRQATFEGETSAARPPQVPFVAAPLVFLVGPHTYSYGETVAELVQRHRLGALLGQPTGGTNGEMNFAAIGRAYLLSWTGRRVVARGQPYQGTGLTPDILVAPTRWQLAQEQDAELLRALEWLQQNHITR